MGATDTIKTLEYWYYDEKEECYKFVFGVNMYGEDIFKEKNDTYKIEFLNNNPELDERYVNQLCKIDQVYNEKKSITELEMEIKKYVEIWKEIVEKAKG